MSDLINMVCPDFPVERYAVELLSSISSPVLSSRLELIGDNLNRVIEYYDSRNSGDEKLLFILDTLSSTVTITISVLRYKSVDRSLAIHNIVAILRFIGENFSYDEYPEFASGFLHADSVASTANCTSNVPRGTKKVTKKVGVSK